MSLISIKQFRGPRLTSNEGWRLFGLVFDIVTSGKSQRFLNAIHVEMFNARPPADAKEAIGHGLRAKRSKSGAISFDLLELEAGVARLRARWPPGPRSPIPRSGLRSLAKASAASATPPWQTALTSCARASDGTCSHRSKKRLSPLTSARLHSGSDDHQKGPACGGSNDLAGNGTVVEAP